jgi:cyclopropane fatty-acyl-phospholipid synthase-like methyltransferase
MNWDPSWERIFRAREWARYPQEDFIRFVALNFFSAPERKQVKILDAGCGTGAGVWFLAREGFDAYGIDGSETGIQRCEKRLKEERLNAHLLVGDCIALADYYPTQHFDAVALVGVITCNGRRSVDMILNQAFAVLKPGGKIFATAIVAGSHGDGLGTEVEPGTFIDITTGAFVGMGLVHFFSLNEINESFARFSNIRIGYFIRSPNNQEYYKHWVIEAEKPA